MSECGGFALRLAQTLPQCQSQAPWHRTVHKNHFKDLHLRTLIFSRNSENGVSRVSTMMLGCGGTLAGVVRILTLLVAGLGCCDGFVVRHDDAGGGGAACRVDVVDVAEIRLVSKAEYESVGDGGASLQGEWMWFMEEVWKMEAPCLEEEDVEGEVFVEVNSTAVEHSSAILQ
eukprot:1388757-Rhodomonas_salina.1